MKESQVIFGQLFEKGLFPHPSDLVTAAGLSFPQDSEVKANGSKDLDEGLRNLLGPGIIRRGTPDVEEGLSLSFSHDLYSQIFCSVRPAVTKPAPGVSVKERMLEGVSYG